MAPEVALPDETGTVHRLADQRGRWTLVYFYPEDDTPGCTTEACQFRDLHDRRSRRAAPTSGASARTAPPATAGSGRSSSCRSRCCRTRTTRSPTRYGAWGEKKNYGRTYMGIVRSSFLVDPDGRIAQAWPRVKADGHAADVLAALAEAAAARARLRPTRRAGGGSDEASRREGTRAASTRDRSERRRGRAAERPHAWRPARFMVIVAHPDDADFGPAATAARWIDAGSVGWLVCCTSGDAGGEDPDADPLELAALARARAARRGRDRRLRRRDLPPPARRRPRQRPGPARAARPRDPDLPARRGPGHGPRDPLLRADGGINHTDHRAAGIAAVDAVYPAARNPMAFPWLPADGLAAAPGPPAVPVLDERSDAWVDVSAHDRPQARRAPAHASQIRDPDRIEAGRANWSARWARQIGVAAAEAFRLIVIDEDEEEAEPA